MTPDDPHGESPHRLGAQLLVTTPIRILLNTAHRMVYPFLPAFSRGLGVPIEALTLLLSLRNGMGLISPLFGLVPDRFGRRAAMLAALTLFVAGLGLVIVWPSFPAFCVAVLAVNTSLLLFGPSLLAYLGDRTPYHRRGLVLALSEIGWSGATLVGIPLLGRLMAGGDWRAPFPPLAALGLLALLGLAWAIPAQSPAREGTAGSATPLALLRASARLFHSPALLGAMSVGLLSALASELLNVVYGQWMESTFHLRIEAIGASVIVIGLAELAGEGAVAGLSDRLGKRRLVMLAGAASALAYLALPFLSGSLNLALAGVFLVYFAFEATIVGNLPLISELRPEARGTVLSTVVMFHAVGRMLGAALGGRLLNVGFVWVGVLAAALNLVAVLIVWRVVHERAEPA